MSPWLNSTSERDERQRHDQVERAHRPEPAPVDEAGQEDRAHRPEHERPVHLAPVRVGQPAGQHPPHLRAGPHLVGPRPSSPRCGPARSRRRLVVAHRPHPQRAEGRRMGDVRVLADPGLDRARAARDDERVVAREIRRSLRRGELHAGDGVPPLGHGDRSEDVLRALRLEQDRPDAPRPVVLRHEVRPRVLRQERHDPAVGLGELDRLGGRQMPDGGVRGRRGREHDRSRDQPGDRRD